MNAITKTSKNGLEVTIGGENHSLIQLKKGGKASIEGSSIKYNLSGMPHGAESCLMGNKITQPLSKEATIFVEDCIKEYKNQPEIRLPLERQSLVDAIYAAYYKIDLAREDDHDNDIGFHLSVQVHKEIDDAELALSVFDKAHKELAKSIVKEKAKTTERNIQSALNA